MAMTLRVAVIGVGSMGRNHARVWAGMPGVELVGVCDLNLERAREVALAYGVSAYKDSIDMLQKVRPDAVSIAVPVDEHVPVVYEMPGGCRCHVLMEKPLSNCAFSCEYVIDWMRKADRVLAVGHIERYNPAMIELKRQIDAGDLGEIYAIHCRRVGAFPARQRDVGVTLDLAVHDLDLLRWLTGREGEVVGAAVRGGVRTEYDDSVSAVLRFGTISASVQADWLSVEKERTIRVVAERGVWRVDLTVPALSADRPGRPDSPGCFWTLGEPDEPEPLALELVEFAKVCRGEAADIVSGEDGLAAVRLAEQVLEVARERPCPVGA